MSHKGWLLSRCSLGVLYRTHSRHTQKVNHYYSGNTQPPLDSDESKSKLIQRLRQYLELRNVTFLIGNGCSIPLGAPLIHDTNAIKAELNQAPYSLVNKATQKDALELLEVLVPKDRLLGVESLLTVLNSLRINAELLQTRQAIGDQLIRVPMPFR